MLVWVRLLPLKPDASKVWWLVIKTCSLQTQYTESGSHWIKMGLNLETYQSTVIQNYKLKLLHFVLPYLLNCLNLRIYIMSLA